MNSTQYKITITTITNYEMPDVKATLIEERHYTDKEIQEDHNWMARGDREPLTKRIYGNTNCIKQESSSKDIYEQVVDSLNIPKVILAINNLEAK